MEKNIKRYYASKFFIAVPALVVVSLIFFIVYASRVIPYRFPTEVTARNVRSLKNNQYVRVTIDRYLEEEHPELDRWFSETSYVTYTVYVGDSAYLPVLIGDSNLTAVLDSYPDGHRERVTFVGRVVKRKPLQDQDYAVYSAYDDMDLDRLIKDSVIFQINEDEVLRGYRIYLFIGCMGLVAAFILFRTVAGIWTVYEKPFEDTKRYREFALGRNYNLKEEVRKEERLLETLRENQSKTKSYFCIGPLVSAVGFFMLRGSLRPLLRSYAHHSYAVLGVVFGVYAMFVGLQLLGYAFINSDLYLAKKITDTFQLRTYPVKIAESNKLILIMHTRLREVEGSERSEEPEQPSKTRQGVIPTWEEEAEESTI